MCLCVVYADTELYDEVNGINVTKFDLGIGLKFNQKVIAYPHDYRAIIALVVLASHNKTFLNVL